MKEGDLVISKRNPSLGLGIVTSYGYDKNGTTRYAWVRFANWKENDKWCYTHNLEVVSEAR